ncbi:MAG TPA: biotin/lipoyl-containing protein, partial [Acetobacteraceae bacterium]|nr:biotin/lipoyl-containing protein [Acetobacteraceae bacterium]
MATEIKVPSLGESVTTATVARWMKQPGEAVAADEPLVELETDKVTVEVNAPTAGVMGAISAGEGDEVEVGALLGTIEAGQGVAAPAAKPATPASASAPAKPVEVATAEAAPARIPAGVNP